MELARQPRQISCARARQIATAVQAGTGLHRLGQIQDAQHHFTHCVDEFCGKEFVRWILHGVKV